ncbi:M16 family metallopeptidase [Acinetobacter johnsonii]|uniref:M16 family metallopeptidase n=1 Tax=Acinetobacter johnsonii TaxID=40214 RepID=UPI0007386F0B|nr:pitrilysin family protein [Acinetobacter johnsonii]AXF45800.1 insulinase family protein [Acinetobacter johnsonii]KUG38792.1 protease [Acinetobacter johnsonii]MDH1712104.1 insulinase family protein [Acinetobacter johnsonii]WEH95129.1 pitrilysin family protein [Acinetobacter johnsonii]
MLMRFKTLSLSVLLLGFGGTVWAQPVLVKSEQKIEEYKLDNGLRIILAPNDKENKVYMNMVYLTGSLNDPKGKGGLAHLLEHLAFKGTKNVPGDEFQRRLDQYGLMNNASTDYYSTKYINVVRPEQNAINELIHLEAERMDGLVLQEKYVPSEIAIVKREREVRMDQPFSVLMDQMWKSAYGNQYLGRLPIGDLNELQSIKMAELNKFYRDWYAPNNAVFVISGKFDQAAVLKQIDEKFSAIKARAVPAKVKVPVLDASKIKDRQFVVKKGSNLAKYNIYLNGKNENIKTALAVSPYLYTMQPSGHLYQSIVETGTATAVQSTTWLDQDFNMVFMGAVYAPNHDVKKVESALVAGVEKTPSFNEVELNRVKSMIKNAQESMFSSATAVGGMLSDYVVSANGDWTQYFKDQQQLQQLSVTDVNQRLDDFLVPEHRISGTILPTPEDQKKALEHAAAATPTKTLDQQTVAEEPLKDVSAYKAEVAGYVKSSKQYLESAEKQIQRGKLKNGMQYALYPSTTRDDKTYATISIDFGTAESLFNKAELLDLTSYLLLRASTQYSLQDIADHSIDAGGGASASSNGNGINISIVAKKEKFDEFFNFVIDVLKNPTFEQSQFDLIKSQSLASLDRPYTEPETVAALTIARLLETYPIGDIRHHFEPEYVKKQYQAATQGQVKQLYQQFFAMNHAQISVTGVIDTKKMKKTLNQAFANWNSAAPYQRITSDFTAYKAQRVHALSEQREFGSYQSIMTFPVGTYHPDAPALQVLEHILGESQLSSRLAQELREKNALVYGFGSSISLDDWTESGALTIDANYSAGKSAQVSQAVYKVLNELLAKGVTEQEVEAAKADILKKRVTALEDSRNIHRMLIPQMKRNRTLLDREQRDLALAKISKADVDAVIQKYIKLDQLVEVMADQYGKAQPALKK